MTTTARPPSGRDTTRQIVSDLKSSRANARLPLTFLGTHGDHIPAPEQGWQAHMWAHHAFATGAVFAAGIAVNQAIEHGILTSPGWTSFGAVIAGLFGAAGGLIATAGEKFTDWARAYFTVSPAAAGIYLAAVAHVSPWSTGSLVAVAAGTAIGMGTYYKVRTEQDDRELRYVARFATPPPKPSRTPTAAAAPPPLPVADDIDPEARKWNEALAEVGLKGCRFIKRRETLAGYAVQIGLARSGNISAEKVGGKLEALERNLGMLKDCLEWDVAVNREGRELSDRMWIIVDVEDILSKLLEMPDDDLAHTPTTLHEAFRIGTFMDGTPMTLRFREISALIVGVRGRGKTNLFHVIVHQLSRCVDVVLWAIDLKGGRAVKPWLRPWLENRAGRPVFDWVATTRGEATLMVHAAQTLITYRGEKAQGGSKIEPSAACPGVIVLVDEAAALVGQHSGPKLANKAKDWWRNPSAGQISGVLTLCVQLGRSEAVDFVLCTQRATVTMTGGGDLKSQCEMRIGLGVTNPSDATSVFQNNNVAAKKLRKLKDQRTRGACLIENGLDPNHLAGKVYFYGDDDVMLARIDKAATLHAGFPADLPLREQRAIDEALLALTSGECGYGVGPDAGADQRWSMDRAAHLYTEDLPDDWEDDPDDEDLLGVAPTSGAATGTATMARPRAARPTSAPPANAPRPGPTAPTYNQTAIPTSPGHPPVTPSGADGGPQGADRYYVRRFQRSAGDQNTPPPDEALDHEAKRYEDEYNRLVAWLESAPEAEEPTYDTSDPAQQSRYEAMLEVIREAAAAGISSGMINAQMIKRGRGWSQRTQLYPAIKRATKAGLIVQAWERGPYYWHEFAPKRAP